MNAQRNFQKCEFCRKDRKPCNIEHERDLRCKLCVRMNRPCGPRERAANSSHDNGHSAEYIASITAALILLHLCRFDCFQIYGIIYPFPCVYIGGQISGLPSRSWKLCDALQSTASGLSFKMWAFDVLWRKLLECQCAIWTGTFVSELRRNINYYPDRSFESTSTANAAIISSCVQHISHTGEGLHLDFGQHQMLLHQRLQWYRKTEYNIWQLFQHLSSQIALVFGVDIHSLILIGNAFPASHIAYWNGDREAAFELWKQSPGNDILGRTFAHILAEANDVDLMRRIASVATGDLYGAGPDARFLTILAIAVCKSHKECSDYLMSLGPELISSAHYEPRLLDLSLASGSKYLVDQVVKLGCVLPPFTADIVKVIELGRADLATALLHSLTRSCWTTQEEVRLLASRAAGKMEELGGEAKLALRCNYLGRSMQLRSRQNSMAELVTYLQNCRVATTNVREAIFSLETQPSQGDVDEWQDTI